MYDHLYLYGFDHRRTDVPHGGAQFGGLEGGQVAVGPGDAKLVRDVCRGPGLGQKGMRH